jgi:hypothetical protein
MKIILTAIFLIAYSIAAPAQDIATVVSEGLGKNIESATQRAAEAALTQVVGSFIDSSKMVEKRKVIRDGIRSKTKKVSSKISEYSQGMIQSIEVLDAEKDGDFTRVTAKVSVRIEDFKSYIKESVLAEKRVKTGLLAKIKIKKKQSDGLSDLVTDKVLKDILSMQVISPVINGEIEEVTNVKLLKKVNKLVPGEGHVIKIPIKATLNPEFLENALRILDETAEHKHKGGELSDAMTEITSSSIYGVMAADFTNGEYEEGNSLTYKPLIKFFSQYGENKFMWYTVMNTGGGNLKVKDPENIRLYTYPERSVSKLCKATAELGSGNTHYSSYAPKIILSFVSDDNEKLREEMLSPKNNYSNDHSRSSYSVVVHEKIMRPMLYSRGEDPSSILKIRLGNKGDDTQCMVYIDTGSEYQIVTKVSESILANTAKIVLKYKTPKFKVDQRLVSGF